VGASQVPLEGQGAAYIEDSPTARAGGARRWPKVPGGARRRGRATGHRAPIRPAVRPGRAGPPISEGRPQVRPGPAGPWHALSSAVRRGSRGILRASGRPGAIPGSGCCGWGHWTRDNAYRYQILYNPLYVRYPNARLLYESGSEIFNFSSFNRFDILKEKCFVFNFSCFYFRECLQTRLLI